MRMNCVNTSTRDVVRQYQHWDECGTSVTELGSETLVNGALPSRYVFLLPVQVSIRTPGQSVFLCTPGPGFKVPCHKVPKGLLLENYNSAHRPMAIVQTAHLPRGPRCARMSLGLPIPRLVQRLQEVLLQPSCGQRPCPLVWRRC